MKKMLSFAWFAAWIFTAVLPVPEAAAQGAADYKPGQSILYLEGITGKWLKGTYVGATPDGSQPIIREEPNEFYKDGAQKASSWDRIKPAGAATDTPPGAPAPPAIPPLPLPGPAPMPQAAPGKDKAVTPPATGGKPLTQEEIVQFLTARLGDNPFADSQKLQQTNQELGALIKQRGVDFRFSSISDFGNQIGKFGINSTVTGPLYKNFGAPNAQDFLFGTWATTVTGLPVKSVEGNVVITWTEAAAINTGTVTINRDGTYLWKTGTAQGDIAGQWRVATAEDMADSGGAGIVLKNAKGGVEWVVYKYREWDTPDDWIGIVQVASRSMREGGVRVPAGQENKVLPPRR